MSRRSNKYYPSRLPYRGPKENGEDYLGRFVSWIQKEFEDVYFDTSKKSDIEVESSAPGAPYDGMMRIFKHEPGLYGWSPDNLGSGLFIYYNSSWYRITMTEIV